MNITGQQKDKKTPEKREATERKGEHRLRGKKRGVLSESTVNSHQTNIKKIEHIDDESKPKTIQEVFVNYPLTAIRVDPTGLLKASRP